MPSPARETAYAVIRRVAEQGAYADRALHAEARQLSRADRQLAMTLAYGTIQRQRTLDHLLTGLSDRPPGKLDPPVRAALRLGLFQLAYLDRIPDHAAVTDSVELAKRHARAGHNLVNAVLRRAAREKTSLRAGLDDLPDDTPQQAGVKHSAPDWLAELWWRELGPGEARRLLAHINQPPESAIRINTLTQLPEELLHELPAHHPDPEIPEARILEEPFDVFGSTAWQEGRIAPQSRASMLVSLSLDPRPGERILDLCAAPGAKTTHLAALTANRSEIVAVEAHPGRARALAETCRRLQATAVRIVQADARELPEGLGEFDRVLIDPPCSGLGTLQSRPDLRWQERRSHLGELVARQAEILRSGARKLKPGGTLVYSVCTISDQEGPALIAGFRREHPGFALERERQLLPHRDGTDGFYIARLRCGSAAPER